MEKSFCMDNHIPDMLCPFDDTAVSESWRPLSPVNHTSCTVVVTSTDCTKSACNCYLIKTFYAGVVLSLGCSLFSVGIWGFWNKSDSFFSLVCAIDIILHCDMLNHQRINNYPWKSKGYSSVTVVVYQIYAFLECSLPSVLRGYILHILINNFALSSCVKIAWD